MTKKFYVVNAGRFGGTSRATHIMQSSSPSTPDPRSPGGVIAQLLWFGGNAKTTLCGLQTTRHVNVFGLDEVSCRECKRRWKAARGITVEDLQPVEEALDELTVIVDGMVAERQRKIEEVASGVQEVGNMLNELEADINDLAAMKKERNEEIQGVLDGIDAREEREAEILRTLNDDGNVNDDIVRRWNDVIDRRWIEENIPEENRTVDVVFDKAGEIWIIHGIREH